MSIGSKTVFMKRLEENLRDKLTASDMSMTLSIVADQLASFDIEQIDHKSEGKDDLLRAYLSALQIQGRSEKTIEQYRYIISRMMSKLSVSTRDVTVYHLRDFLASEKKRGLADSTLEGRRQIISAYFNWLKREELISSNPVANLGAIKTAKKIKKVFTDIEIELLKTHAKTVRDKAIVCFLLSSACRVEEMTKLDISDVDFDNLECRVVGKGNKERIVYIDAITSMLLLNYLRCRTDDCNALFVSNTGIRHRLTTDGVRRMLVKLGKAASVEHVHPHKFRRTKATDLIRHGMPIQEVASILGHDKLDTTMKYVVLDKSDVKNAYQKYA